MSGNSGQGELAEISDAIKAAVRSYHAQIDRESKHGEDIDIANTSK